MRRSREYVRILKAIRCVKVDMDNPRDMEASGPFVARYLAFLEQSLNYALACTVTARA